MVSIIVLMTPQGYIALKKDQQHSPFQNKYDMKNFTNKTINNTVCMGWNTWISLPKKPLQNRINIVFSTIERNLNFNNTIQVKSIKEYLNYIKNIKDKEHFVIGGTTLYNQFMNENLIDKIYITEMVDNLKTKNDYDCKLNFTLSSIQSNQNWIMKPTEISNQNWATKLTEKIKYYEFNYNNIEELKFLKLLKNIIDPIKGYFKPNRTGINTYSIFSPPELRFTLENNTLPLFCTRPLKLKSIIEELLWFLRGQTNVNILRKKGVHIWDNNTNQDFLDKRGLDYQEWDLGPSYSFQWRHFGAKYDGYDKLYTNGFDQLSYIISELKNNPNSRRIMVNLWNPEYLHQMTLPPCVFGYQFYVTPFGELITKIYQRSSDIFLAGNWNIISASILTYMLSSVCGLKPKEIIWSPGDTHVYENQIDALNKYLKRKPDKPFPKLYLKESAPSLSNGKLITEFEYSDFILLNYYPNKKINIPMNI